MALLRFNDFINQRAHYVDDLVSYITTGESQRFGGYQSNFSGNKGMRGGLLEGKTAIRRTSPHHLTKACCTALEKEKLSFVVQLKNTVIEELDNIIPQGIWHKVTQRKRSHWLQKIRSDVEAKTDGIIIVIQVTHKERTRLIFDVIKERQLFTTKMKDDVSALLSSYAKETMDKTLKHTLENILVELDGMFNQFERHTFVELEYCDETFLRHCLSAVRSEECKYQQLPGDDGVYEIVGLKGVASRLEYLLKQIQTESDGPTSSRAQTINTP